MSSPLEARLCWVMAGLALGFAPTAVAETPRPVSPGSTNAAVRIADSCPTFSWSGAEDATGHELVLYRVDDNGVLSMALQTMVAGDARGWTPAAADCPASDASYAWAVRALTEDGPGSWSELFMFDTAGVPSDDEVRQALDTLRLYRRGREGAVGDGLAPSLDRPGELNRSDTETQRYPSLGLEGSDSALRSPTVGSEPAPQAVTVPGSYSLSLSGDMALDGAMFKDGAPFLHNNGGAGAFNTAVGWKALISSTPGNPSNNSGKRNTGVGHGALLANSTGFGNTALGYRALRNLTSGFHNTALGYEAALTNGAGYKNTVLGSWALRNNQVGRFNTVVGSEAAKNATAGNTNTAVGAYAGLNWSSGSFNVALGAGAVGSSYDTGVIRIGGYDLQDQAFIEGVSETGVSGSQLFITTNDQIGIATSSARFKQDIRDLEGAGDRLLDLRPVSFRYKPDKGTPSVAGPDRETGPLEYGLIAEEVAEIFPELVINDEDGKPFTVRYHLLTPLLLAEIQRQDGELRKQDQEIADLRRTVDRLSRTERWRKK